MKWETVKFESLYAIESRNGLTKPSKVRGSGYKMINMGELFANDRIYDIPMELVPLKESEKNCKVEQFDLLFARQSLVLEGAGKCSIVMDVSPLTVFESHLIRVRLNKDKADPLFYYYYFRSPFSPIKSIVSQCAQAGIRGSDLSLLEVIRPPLKQQKDGDRSFMLDGSYKLTDISAYKHSLEIIKAANIQLDGKKASFYYRGKSFKYVSVTDPDYKGIEQTLEEAYLVISIPTDDYDGYGYFKFIAAIYPIEKKPWGKEEDEDLTYEYRKKWPIELMAATHKRTEEEIRKRISFLHL